MVVFRICDIEVGMQTVDKDMVAKVMVESLSTDDKGNINYDDFQAQQLSGIVFHRFCLIFARCPIRLLKEASPTTIY